MTENTMPGYAWQYLPNGKVAHLVLAGLSVCGRDGVWGVWYGTGTQDEYDKAAALPHCKRCEKQVTP